MPRDTGFYVGSIGFMVPLPWVDGAVDASVTRLGGSAQSLEGRQWRDTLGILRAWTWKYDSLLPAQLPFIEALTLGLVRGPIRLIDPRRPNRLPVQVASGGSHAKSADGFAVTIGGLEYDDLLAIDLEAPTLPMAAFLSGCIQWKRPNAGSGVLYPTGYDFGGQWTCPVSPRDEDLVIEAWVGGQAGVTPVLSWVEYDRLGNGAGYTSAATTDSVALSASEWQYVGVEFHPQPGTVAVQPRLTVDDAQAPGSIYTTGWQLRSADAELMPGGVQGTFRVPEIAGGWRIGGGCPEVVADPPQAPGGMIYDPSGFTATGLILTESEGE